MEDLHSLTPNAFCQIVETVAGSGLILLCVNKWEPFTLCGGVMGSHLCGKPNALYTARLLQSLTRRKKTTCFTMINAAEIPGAGYTLGAQDEADDKLPTEPIAEVTNRTDSIPSARTPPPSTLSELCLTSDQKEGFRQATEWLPTAFTTSNQPTVGPAAANVLALTAARGRGKSALLGIILAHACATLPLSDIAILCPCLANVKTLIEFSLQAFTIVGFEVLAAASEVPVTPSESRSETTSTSTNKRMGFPQSASPVPNAVIELGDGAAASLAQSITQKHGAQQKIRIRSTSSGVQMTIHLLTPADLQAPHTKHMVLHDIDLVFIDEAAAIPLPLVQSVLSGRAAGLMASTLHGYEGTGRSLAIKLTKVLESEGRLKSIELKTPIRYAENDRVEHWLMKAMCLEATIEEMPEAWTSQQTRFIDALTLSVLDKSVLFDCTQSDSRRALREVMAIFVTSHYRNNPNDMWMLADNPSYQVVVLHDDSKRIYAAAQVSFEGNLTAADIIRLRGKQTSGDMLTWKLQEITDDLSEFIGVRVVRIACHPSATGKRLGTLLLDGIIDRLIEHNEFVAHTSPPKPTQPSNKTGEGSETTIKSALLFRSLNLWDINAVIGSQSRRIAYMGTSFGLSDRLLRFWTRNPISMTPFYLAQVPNEATGEYTIMLLRALDGGEFPAQIPLRLRDDVGMRFAVLLADCYRTMNLRLAAAVLLQTKCKGSDTNVNGLPHWTTWHYKRLRQYGKANAAASSTVRDLWPDLALAFARGQLGEAQLTPVQVTLLTGLGLQRQSIEDLARDLGIPIPSLLNQVNRLAARLDEHISSSNTEKQQIQQGPVSEPPPKVPKTTNLQFRNIKRT